MTATTKQKVSDLPKEEQEAIFTQLTDLNVRGASGYLIWTVETAQKKIAEKIAENANSGQGGDANGGTGEAPTSETATQNDGVADAGVGGENPEGENETTPTAPASEPTKTTPTENPTPQAGDKATKKEPEKVLLCHVCRSRVIKGKCTGCGFELRF